MSAAMHQQGVGEQDRQLPGHRRGVPRPASTVARVVGSAVGAIGVSLVAATYLVGAPIVAFATGLSQIVAEIRENAIRPRPFVGARHGLPFLDRMGTPATDTEE